MSKATNPQNLRKGSRVVIVDPAVAADYKRGHVGRVIDVVHTKYQDETAETIVIVRCENCTLDDGTPNHHYMDALDVTRVGSTIV
jgi:hypothetical protein